MRVVAIDTSTALGSVAVTDGAGRTLAEAAAGARARHGETLLPLVDATLSSAGMTAADVTLWAVGVGPGSFTGLRIGLATAKGLSLASGVPLVGVSSLAALAEPFIGCRKRVVACIDAHKGQLFVSMLEGGAMTAPQALLPNHLATQLGARAEEALFVGDGLAKHRDAIEAVVGPIDAAKPACWTPRAAHVAAIAVRQMEREGPSDIDTLEPNYVRPSDAKLPSTPLRLDVDPSRDAPPQGAPTPDDAT